MIIQKDFYERDDVVLIAKELLGTVLHTRINNTLTAGMIVETEAYCGSIDRASHAFPNRKTKRNHIMFDSGGKAYVYLIYGIHYLFNIVTNRSGAPDAVLIRALQPIQGIETMMKRRNKTSSERITSGPGSLSQAMAIDLDLYGEDLQGNKVWLEFSGNGIEPQEVIQTTRIGVEYAGEDARLPWRFYYKDNPWVSKP